MGKPHAVRAEHAVNRGQNLIAERTELMVKGGDEVAS
jgi:hypothetical protein